MLDRRKFIRFSTFTSFATVLGKKLSATENSITIKDQPLVVSTWDAGLRANKAAWDVLSTGGRALDAVEQGVMVTEAEHNCCVGLNANPET